MLQPRMRVLDLRTAKPPPKTADPYYATPKHRAWRAKVIADAGGRCEWIRPDGTRCNRAEPRMFADHVHERKDGGPGLGRGQCLCGQHHSIKTAIERRRRESDEASL
jgi:5-methylcytosine-specific restriction enzyme A